MGGKQSKEDRDKHIPDREPKLTEATSTTIESKQDKIKKVPTVDEPAIPSEATAELSQEKPIISGIQPLNLNTTMENENGKIRKVTVATYKQANTHPGTEKVLMVLGATGAGKTTLINGMVNYMMGVKYKDKYRYKLVDEGSGSQAHSQTRWITAYTFEKEDNSVLPYTLTIIDTPGYGDTQGIERDKRITKQIIEFFSLKGPQGIDHLDGIGFVVKAPDARLTPTQRYIFDSILSIFGKDISQNIFMMVTFADGNKPPVLAAIREAKFEFQRSFKFNNSALYAKENNRDEEDNSDEDGEDTTFNSMFWKMGEKSYEDFFRSFGKAESVSLQLTKEVLEEREHLECVIQGLQQNIHAGLSKVAKLQQEENAIKQNEIMLQANKHFTYKTTETRQKKDNLPTGVYVTNCLTCNKTCHYPCKLPRDEDKVGCAAISRTDLHCEICPGRCYWKQHVNNEYQFIVYDVTIQGTYEDLKTRYHDAKNKKSVAENIKAGLRKELQKLNSTVFDQLKQANRILDRLKEIALRPNPLTDEQYIELLIEAEKNDAKPGFQRRIRVLEDLREKAKLLAGAKDERKLEEMQNEDDLFRFSKLKSK